MPEEPLGAQAAKSQRTRRSLLDAAGDIAHREGVANLTLARVAEKANVSKGGLLHHFASKQALIAALLTDNLESANQQLEQLAAENGRDRGAFAQAYLDYVRTGQHSTGTAASVFAAAALDDGDLGPARAMFENWQERLIVDDLISPETALLARVVGDGLWLIDLFGLAPPTPEQREILLKLVEDRL